MAMDLSAHAKSQLEMSRSVYDLSSTNVMREGAHSEDEAVRDASLEEAAKQFEAIFVQMMLQSMRKAQEALADEDSPFNSEQVKYFRDMHDKQLASDLASNGSIGLAEVILQQLGNDKNVTPASILRNDGNLDTRRMVANAAPANNANNANGVNGLSSLNSANFEGTVSKIAEPNNTKGMVTKQAAFDSPQDFIASLYPQAKAAAERLGISAKALISQAAVETGWGKYMIHKSDGNNAHNLFGIKADRRWQGDKAQVSTIEYVNDLPEKQQAAFRAYNTFADSLQDYVDFIQSNPRYEQALKHTQEPAQYFEHLQRAGYATDPSYADKVMSVFNSKTMSEILP